jgi:hypothetical protein
MKPKKIDVTAYDVVNRFGRAHEDSMKSEVAAYKSGDYLSYIKYRCLSLFFSWSNFAFMYKTEKPGLPEITPFSSFQFPTGGREHDFQAFKKLGLVEKISSFNESHSCFYSTLAPDWGKIQDILTEHHERWKQMPAFERVNLLDKLHSLYEGRENNVIYVQYFIYENEYLNQQFDRFISAKDFYEWWEKEVLTMFKPSDDVHPVSILESIISILRENEGILQSAMYEKCDDPREDVSSAIYFAAKEGKIIRIKDGSSYRLYLPEQVKDATQASR